MHYPQVLITESALTFQGGNWTERIFYGAWDEYYYECFTISIRQPMKIGRRSMCGTKKMHIENAFVFSFYEMQPIKNENRPQIEVYVHEKEEPYSELPIFDANKIIMDSFSMTELLITHSVVEFQDKKRAPCSRESNHSYIRV